MDELILLENLPQSANLLLNILWQENRAMSASELMEHMNQIRKTTLSEKEIKEFLHLLVREDYVERKLGWRRGFKMFYAALGSDYKL